MDEPYALKKQGMYYAHNSCGYVQRIINAELYTKEYATRYAASHEEVLAIPVSTALSCTDEVQEYIYRLEAMRDFMKFKESQ